MTKSLLIVAVATLGATSPNQTPSGVWTTAQRPGTTGIAQNAPAGVVRVWHKKGQDLTTLLQQYGKAKVIQVVRQGSPPYAASTFPDADAELRQLTSTAHVVARMKVTHKVASFSEQRDWINSTAHGVILEVIKASEKDPFSNGDTVAFPELGGELEIGDKRLAVTEVWTRPTSPGREYLSFWWMRPDGTWHTLGQWTMFELRGARWVRLLTRPHNGGIEQLDSADVLSRIRALVASNPSSKPAWNA